LDIARCGLVEQFLQSTPVIQAATHFRHEFFGNIHGEPSFSQPAVQDVTGMLLAGRTSGAVRSNATRASQAEGAQQSGLNIFGLILKPVPDIGRGLSRVSFHVHICAITHIYTSREKCKKLKKIAKRLI
jgi:hypothetical protein